MDMGWEFLGVEEWGKVGTFAPSRAAFLLKDRGE